MRLPTTEEMNPLAKGLDAKPSDEVLRRLLSGQVEAARAVADALPAIEAAAGIAADALRSGARLVYAGAGSSALMANADAMEINGTFGIDPDRILLLMAGGLPKDAHMPGDSEDDAAAAGRAAEAIGPGDAVIAVTASGRTPYPLAIARIAKARGARVIAIANNRDAPVFGSADVAVCLPTPPELIAGSTRMGAGTAQKIALNMISTLMGIKLGQVHDGMMVGLIADNDKLRGRAAGMVAAIAGVSGGAADIALGDAKGNIKLAVLIAKGMAAAAADAALTQSNGNLRSALARIEETGRKDRRTTTNHGSEP
ncbi:MAG: N-acetylmuramic acid 6-phosphate etherase [Paracoccaceae bacterium]